MASTVAAYEYRYPGLPRAEDEAIAIFVVKPVLDTIGSGAIATPAGICGGFGPLTDQFVADSFGDPDEAV